MRIQIDERIAVDVIDRKSFGFSAARIAGGATDRDPARIVLLHRHADMGDDTADDEAQADVEGGAERVASILENAVRDGVPSDLGAAVEEAHGVVRESGTYYSALLAVVNGSHLVASGIGNVSLHLWTSDSSQSILNPTTIAVGNTRVLAGALGLGFQPDRIQKTALSLSAGNRIIIGVDVEVSFLQPMGSSHSSNDVLQFILEKTSSRGTGIVGVIS